MEEDRKENTNQTQKNSMWISGCQVHSFKMLLVVYESGVQSVNICFVELQVALQGHDIVLFYVVNRHQKRRVALQRETILRIIARPCGIRTNAVLFI